MSLRTNKLHTPCLKKKVLEHGFKFWFQTWEITAKLLTLVLWWENGLSSSVVKNNPHGITISRTEHKHICHTDSASKTSELCFLLCHGSQVWWYTPAMSEHRRVSSWRPALPTEQVWGLDNMRPCLQNQNRKKKRTKTKSVPWVLWGEVWEVPNVSRVWSVLTGTHFCLSVNNTGKDSCKRVSRWPPASCHYPVALWRRKGKKWDFWVMFRFWAIKV